MDLALDYRNRFASDVFVDLLGYRRFGHSEADEPRFTQPSLYREIERHPDPREIYLAELTRRQATLPPWLPEAERTFQEELGHALVEAQMAAPTFCLAEDECDRFAHWDGRVPPLARSPRFPPKRWQILPAGCSPCPRGSTPTPR